VYIGQEAIDKMEARANLPDRSSADQNGDSAVSSHTKRSEEKAELNGEIAQRTQQHQRHHSGGNPVRNGSKHVSSGSATNQVTSHKLQITNRCAFVTRAL
jgi:hypothetical protein